MVTGIFFAVDRCHMRGISIEIRPSDSELLSMCVDPIPQGFTGSQSLRPCRAFYADDIRCKPVAIPSTEAATMIGPVIGRLKTAGDRLAIVIAECTSYAG